MRTDFEQIKRLCDVAIEFPRLADAVEKLIDNILNQEKELSRLYDQGEGKLQMVKYYKSLNDCTLMEAKHQIEGRFAWPNPNMKRVETGSEILENCRKIYGR